MNTMHRVRRWRWQARAPDSGTALSMRRLLHAQHEACAAALDRASAALVPPGEVWRVPRLDLSVQLADLAEIGTGHLAEQVEAALRTTLAELASVHGDVGKAGGAQAAPCDSARRAHAAPLQRQADEADARASLRHYLHTGMLPWTLAGLGGDAGHEVLVAAAVAAAGAVGRGDIGLEALLPTGSDAARIGALQRWLVLLPPNVRRAWLAAPSHGAGLPVPITTAWHRWVDVEATDRLAWQALWLALPLAPAVLRAQVAAATSTMTPPFAAALAERLDAAAAPASPTVVPSHARTVAARAHPTQSTPAATSPIDAAPASLPVPLAGLVLLHPWLPRLLGACGVLDGTGKRIEPAARPKALALLHALAYGDAERVEHQLPFAKLMLGGRLDEPLDTLPPRLGAEDRAEIDALLTAVREHWSALRGTGVDGLRLSFLQRRGLLSRDDSGWRLRIDNEPFDLLLGTLPWSIGLVRLPWMPLPLSVEWHAP